MGTFFKPLRRKIALLMLVAYFVFMWGWVMLLVPSRPPTPHFEYIEHEAIEAIDYEQLEKPLMEFIELVKSHAVLDQPASRFINVLNDSIGHQESTQDGTTVGFSFALPATDETLKRLRESYFGMVAPSPYLWVEVNKKTGKICVVSLYVDR